MTLHLLEIIALTLDLVGKILIAITAIMVHHRVKEEMKIDKAVLKQMKLEQNLGIVGIALIVIAYVIHLLVL